MSADLTPVDAAQREIIAALHVAPVFDAALELERRVDFLAGYLKQTGLKSLVLGISGGVDSLTAGCLAQRAVQKLRAEGRDATFIAMRLPYGVQKDEAEAQASLAVIKPDRTVTVDIRPAADGMLAALKAGDLEVPRRRRTKTSCWATSRRASAWWRSSRWPARTTASSSAPTTRPRR
jgi:NAD+ synthase